MDLLLRRTVLVVAVALLWLGWADGALAQAPQIEVTSAVSTQVQDLSRPEGVPAPATAKRIIVTSVRSLARAGVGPTPENFGPEPARRITITSALSVTRVVIAPRPDAVAQLVRTEPDKRITITSAQTASRVVMAPRPNGPTDTHEPDLRIRVTAAVALQRVTLSRPNIDSDPGPTTPQISGVDPAQPLARPTRQWLGILGERFTPDSQVILRIQQSEYPIPEERTSFITSERIDVFVGLVDPGTWTAQVVNPGDLASNEFEFTVRELELPPPPGGDPGLRAEAGDVLGSFILRWHAPGPEQAASYDIRYSKAPITEANWNSAEKVKETPPTPAPPGTMQQLPVTGLPTGPLDARYHFALRSANALGEASPISSAPATVTCKYAVVLVHGWQSSSSGAWKNDDLNFAAALENDGFCVYHELDLEPNNGDIAALSNQLQEKVNELVGQGYTGVDLVAHSMGGLVSRYYTNGDPGKVRNIVMLGTPNHGTPLFTEARLLCLIASKLGPLAVKACLVGLELYKGEAGRQMEAVDFLLSYQESLFLRDLNRLGLIDDIDYWTVAGTSGYPLLRQLLRGEDDGLVSVGSVCLGEGDTHEEYRAHFQYPLNHSELHSNQDVLETVKSILNGTVSQFSVCDPLVDSVSRAVEQDPPLISQVLLEVSGELPPGEQRQHNIPLEAGISSVLFTSLASDAGVEFSLQSLSGTIDSTSPFYSEDADGLLKLYELTDPEPGDWALVVSLPESAVEPALYQLVALIEAEVVLSIDMAANIFVPGELVEITAHLQAAGQPISGAAASALITDPDGATSSVGLTDNGDGSYGLSYLPSGPGRYEVEISVAGEREGQGFVRLVNTAFWVVDGAPLEGVVELEGRTDHYGASISLEPGGLSTLSASDGSFAFLRIPEGTYELTVSAAGYQQVSLEYIASPSVEPDILPPIALQIAVTCGDLNGDNVMSIRDLVLMLQIVAGLFEPTVNQLFLGDLSRSGQVGIDDAVMAMQAIVGLRPPIEQCGPAT